MELGQDGGIGRPWSSPAPTGTLKLQLCTEQLLMRKTRIYKKRHSTTEDTFLKKHTMRHIGEAWSQYSQDPYPPCGRPINRRIITIAEGLSKQQWVQAPHWDSVSGPSLATWALKQLALKASRAYFGKSRELWKIETLLLKSWHKISPIPGPKTEA